MTNDDSGSVKRNRILSRGRGVGRRGIVASLAALSIVSLSAPVLTHAQSVPAFGFYAEWDSTWSYNAYAVNYALALSGPLFVSLPLAFQLQPSGAWDPQLAKSWTFSGNKLIVTLQPNAKWQTGQAVTSTDVVDSYILGLAAGWAWGTVASKVSALNSHQVAFTLRKTTSSGLPVTKPTVESDILGEYVQPASVYGRLVTAKLKSEEVTDLTSTSKSVAAKASDYVLGYDKTLTAYDPANIIGDGPFVYHSMTTNEMSLTKSKTFFDASRVHVNNLLMWNVGANGSLATTEMFAGTLDFGFGTNTKNVVDEWKSSSPDHHYAQIPTLLGQTFFFNNNMYPFNNVKVRQALNYAVNRPDVSIAGEGFHGDTFAVYPTGLPQGLQNAWLGSNATLAKEGFNAYAYNTAKARQILKSVGFTYKGGEWYTPKGKQFTISIETPGGWSSTQLNASNLASQLSAFGIKSTASSIEQPGYWTDLLDGDFQMAWQWDGYSNVTALGALDALLAGQNYVPGTTERGMGFGPDENVPGLGKVNLAKALTTYENLAEPSKIRTYTYDFAKLINEQVPILQFDTKDSQTYWSTKYYTDWPPLSDHSLWDTAGDNPQETIPLMLEAGYIRPK